MADHDNSCKPGCNDSHDWNDSNSRGYWGGASGLNEESYSDTRSRSNSSSSCFIATVVYGDVEAPEVITLRAFRDNVLKKSAWGRSFIATYYRLSPPIAEWLKTKPRISTAVRSALDTLVNRIK